MERFLLGYHRDKQFDQSVYLEVLIEKNTLLNITSPVCREYYVPMTSGQALPDLASGTGWPTASRQARRSAWCSVS